ncbi:MAG: S9 family peptidase [Phycisphaerales bacterium]|nr:S9 family peptidase [Phycisphaerales bacterium]
MPTLAKPKNVRRAPAAKPTKLRHIQADDLLKFHIVSDPQISPDGKQIVFVKKHVGEKNEYLTNLWIADTAGKNEPRQFTTGGKDHHPRWSGNSDGDARIAFASGRDKPKPQIWTIPIEGGEATSLTKFPEGSLGDFKWSPDGKLIAASFREQDPDWTEEAKNKRKEKNLSDPPRVLDDWWYRLDGDGYFNGQRYHLYLIDTDTGEHRKVYTKDTLGHFNFDFSPDSKQLVIATNQDKLAMIRPQKAQLVRLDVSTGKVTVIPNLPEGPKDKVIWSPDGKAIAFAGREGDDGLYDTENLQLYVCDPIKGNARCLTAGEDYCLMAVALSDSAEVAFCANIQWSPDSKRIFMQIGWKGESHIASIAATGGQINFHTSGSQMHSMGNIVGNGKPRMALTVGDRLSLGEVHVGEVSPASIQSKKLSSLNDKLLGQLKLSKPESHWIKSADGNDVQVWSINPIGFKSGKKYPAILEIHGGPHAMYGGGFFHEFQLLAANGFAVFFSNPRGSKGYGRDHCAAIRGSWGGADWIDIQAVTSFMKKQSFVDAKRMGVMGGSYGGYMTNWVIGHTGDFKAAITDRCVSNLVSLLGTSDYVEPPDQYWPGNTWDRPEKLWDMSPLKYLGNAKTPTLIIHSEGDLRCNVEQAEQVFTALKLNNVPTRFVRYPGSTSHGLSRGGPPDLRVHRLSQILDWWNKWLA